MKLLQDEIKQEKVQQQISLLVTILLILAVALCVYTAIQVLSQGYVNLGGFMMFRVVTGSMEPTIPVGALLLTREVEIDSIQMGDVICFRTQAAEIWGKIVTHRVIGIEASAAGPLLFTKGDANLVADGYYVDRTNFVSKVVWHTGDGSVLANVLTLFTNKIGFLGCIVFPALLLAALILKDSVVSIRQELNLVLEMQRRTQYDWESDPLCGMTQEEYDEMYERIRAEIMEELMQLAQIQKGQERSSEISEADAESSAGRT